MNASEPQHLRDAARPAGTSVMDMTSLITRRSVLPHLKVLSKPEALAVLAQQAAELTSLAPQRIYQALVEREHLGTTGIGGGVAIPHARLTELGGLCVVFARLAHPLDFEAIDEQPVNLIFLLLSPESESADHLKALSRISRLLHDASLCRKLRGTDSVDGVCELLHEHLAV